MEEETEKEKRRNTRNSLEDKRVSYKEDVFEGGGNEKKRVCRDGCLYRKSKRETISSLASFAWEDRRDCDERRTSHRQKENTQQQYVENVWSFRGLFGWFFVVSIAWLLISFTLLLHSSSSPLPSSRSPGSRFGDCFTPVFISCSSGPCLPHFPSHSFISRKKKYS